MVWTKEYTAQWRVSHPEKNSKYKKAYREKDPEKHRSGVEAWHAQNPDARKCHNTANRARREGKLVATTCEKCGAASVVMHHPDYTKPLAVQWLCRSCHRKVHLADKNNFQQKS